MPGIYRAGIYRSAAGLIGTAIVGYCPACALAGRTLANDSMTSDPT